MNYMLSKYLFFGLTILLSVNVNAQIEEQPLPQKYSGMKWEKFVEEIEQEYNLKFYYQNDSLQNLRTNFPDNNQSGINQISSFFYKEGYFVSYFNNCVVSPRCCFVNVKTFFIIFFPTKKIIINFVSSI